MAKPEGPVARKSDYQIAICPSKLAAKVVETYHYSKSTSHRALSFCAVHPEDGSIAAVVQFLPPLPPAAKLVANLGKARGLDIEPRDVITLTRLVVVPDEPQNVASLLVGAALRQLRRDARWKAVVTFADKKQGHTGQVYRALNAEYLGETKPETVWIDPSTAWSRASPPCPAPTSRCANSDTGRKRAPASIASCGGSSLLLARQVDRSVFLNSFPFVTSSP